MSEWISVKTSLPDRAGWIVVWIGKQIFLGYAYEHYQFIRLEENIVGFCIPHISQIGEISVTGSGGWIIPDHFKEPTHWMFVGEPENE